MSERIYVSVPEALALHQVLLARYGGTAGVRDLGALAAALTRPQLGYYDTIVEEAAALFESIAIGHPFLDGNKRLAFAVMDVFLRLNGMRIEARADDALAWVEQTFAEGSPNIHSITGWLDSRVKGNR